MWAYMSHLRVPPAKRETCEKNRVFSGASRHGYGFISCDEVHRCLASHWELYTQKMLAKRGHVTCPRSQDLWPRYVCATGARIFYVLHVSWCRRESVLSIEADYQNTWYLEVVVKVVKVDIENRTCVVPNYHVPPSRLEVVVLGLAIFISFSCLSNIPWNLWRTWFRLPRRLGVSTWPDINIYRNSVSFAETTWKQFFLSTKTLRFYQVQDRVWTLELFFLLVGYHRFFSNFRHTSPHLWLVWLR